MNPDKLEQEGADTSPNEPERPPTPIEHPSSPSRSHKRSGTTTIMVLGPSGSGKSSLINTVSGETFQVASEGAGVCTTQFRSSLPFIINGRPFRLIDSPGFNKSSPDDFEIMKKLIFYLARARDRWNTRLTGVLYLHPEGGGLENDRLKEIMETIRHLFGDAWLPSVTIAVSGNGSASSSDTVSQLKTPTSPFHSVHSGGAKILPLSLESRQIQEILLGFDPSSPPQPRFYYKIRFTPPNRIDGAERFLEDIMKPRRADASGRAGRSQRITLEESEASRQQLQTTLDENEMELKSLRSQLEQTQLEYASLRSELQLNDNTEQSKIVQAIQDLNRAIDDFGRSVAEYMVDSFAASFNKDEPTTLDASNFIELQRQFGHQVGKSSLAASFGGDGLPIEDFIDLALRSFLCQRLCKHIFLPFHPALPSTAEPGFIDSLYEEVRRQGSPIVAAKWRASSFMALSKGNKVDKPTVEGQIKGLMAEDIQPLLNNLFGPNDAVTLTDNQCGQLQEIVNMAWELNHVLKGEVVTLGDFQPLFFERGVPFDPKTMVEFEPNKKKGPGEVAICTIRLGLSLFYTKGVGKDAGPSVICPATVVTPTLYG